jgi:hypothetical protein
MFGLQTGNRANKLRVATNLSSDLAEEIRSKAFSEEFTIDFSGDPDTVYPIATTAQSFGLEESTFVSRLITFDDVDDYHNWCEGDDCGSPQPLQSYDGQAYEDPAYRGFTRQVNVFNIFPDPQMRHYRQPFPNASGIVAIDRFNLEEANWPNLLVDQDGNSVVGKSPIKVVEITVNYSGPGAGDVEVKDVSFAVMPLRQPED